MNDVRENPVFNKWIKENPDLKPENFFDFLIKKLQDAGIENGT
jgi:hypothetical protein